MAEGQTRTIGLPAVVDLDVLDSVRDTLLDAVESGSVVVSAGAVERVSTNALLMLIAAAETARRNSSTFFVQNASAPVLSAIERLGLTPSFSGILKG
jgi:anti-anti-sigma regulatory factor